MSEPFRLFRLQQVDSQIDQAHKRLAEITVALGKDEDVQKAKKTVEIDETQLQADQKELKRAEEDVNSQQIKIDQNQNRLYSGKVSNPKELQELQDEEKSFKRYLAVLEDTQLEKMLKFEESDSGLKQSRASLSKVEERAASQNAELINEQTEINNEVNSLQGERETTLAGIPESDLQLYEKLRKKKAGVAVAKVSNKACTACGTILPQALAQAARSADTISLCKTCGRILYSG